MKDWRKMLSDVGGYDNGMVAVPASGVRELIDEVEQLREIVEELAEYPTKTKLDILVKNAQQAIDK